MILFKIQNLIYLIKIKIMILLGSLNILRAYSWGIKLGKGVKFNGICLFFRTSNSEIRIGNNCFFSSNKRLNRIGLMRKCSISTMKSDYHSIIIIGNNCRFSGTVIGAFKSIIIKDNVRCGANTLITDADWHLDDPRSGPPSNVYIDENVWLGEGVRVLKGVTIGRNSLIGAGSVVTRDIPENVIAAGNPCRIIKQI